MFGLGMLLYFVLTGRDPEPNAQKAADFESKTRELIAARQKSPFGSIIAYLAALVRRATCDNQIDRIGVPAFTDGLQLVVKALQEKALVAPSDLILVEIQDGLAKTGVWQPEPFQGGRARLHAGAGEVTVAFEDIDVAPVLIVRIEFNSAGDMVWSSIGKYLRTRLDQVRSILSRSGLDVRDAAVAGTSLRAVAHCSDRHFTVPTMRRLVEAVLEAATKATF